MYSLISRVIAMFSLCAHNLHRGWNHNPTISNWQKRVKLAKQQLSTVKLKLQFLARHKQQYDGLGNNLLVCHTPQNLELL